jgi:hypothetical protein
MRFKLMLCGATLVPAALLAGCGVNQTATFSPDVQSPAIQGRTFGGQQPVVGATVEVVAMGTTGYGSPGTVLAHSTTDSNGNFAFAPGAYTCPQSDTPVYLMSIGGNSGFNNAKSNPSNLSAVEVAGMGPCAAAQQSYVVINEVTTAATAFVLSHFFSPTLGGSNGANDWFGGPSSGSAGSMVYSKGLVNGNNVTIPAIVSNATGTANQDKTGYTNESQKIYTIANILASCVNTNGSTNGTQPCAKLFNYTTSASGVVPTDTLQAAVEMALQPTTQVTKLYNLISGTPAFDNYLSAPPNDWTIGVSYTSTALGLAVDTGTTSTLDIDSTGNVWFPSNATGLAGAAYFDPVSLTFNGPYNSTGLVHPQQVAIDAIGYAWYNDSSNSAVSGYMDTAPMTTQSVSLPGTLSSAVTVGGDDSIDVGITNSSTYEEANISADRSSYSPLRGISFPFPVASLASDMSNNDIVAIDDPVTTATRMYYVTPAPTETHVVNANANSGQAIFTGNDYVQVRSYAGSAADGLCIYSTSTCSSIKGGNQNVVEGIAIDGGKNLWIAESADAGVLQVPVNNPSGTGAAIYLNGSGANNIPANEFLHGSGNGGTATAPYGIAVDATGNVWVSNAGCNTNDCAPGSFTLTEIVGAGYPTITPVSAQITSGTNLVGTEPTN